MQKPLSVLFILFAFGLSLVYSVPASAAADAPGNTTVVSSLSDQPVSIQHLIVRHTAGSGLAQSLALLDQASVMLGNNQPLTGIDAASLANARVEVETSLSALAGAPLTYFRPMSGEARVFKIVNAVNAATALEMSRKIGQSPDVVYAEPDWPMQATLIPNDTYWVYQWSLNPSGNGAVPAYSADMPTAWDYTTGAADMRIAVIDTGLLKGNPQISSRYVGGYDFITDTFTSNDGDGRDADASDPGDWFLSTYGCGTARNSSWHGTHVSGIIAASSNDSDTVVGINWQSKILPVRVLGKCGGWTSDIVDAMRWAAGLTVAGVPANAYPAKVLILSLGGSGACATSYQLAINDVNAAGAITVVSAGNSAADASGFQPASCSGVITVGASEVQGYKSSYSNYGAGVTLSAQGGDAYPPYLGGTYDYSNWRWIFSLGSTATTVPNGVYATIGMTGTSQAAPHVAGVVSLMLSLKPALTRAQIVSYLQTTATPYNPAAGCGTTWTCSQSGILNAGRALAAVNDPPTISSIADQTINQDTSTGAMGFTVGDDLTPVANLTVTGTSDNTTLLPNAQIVLGGSGSSRNVTLTPAAGQLGIANVTLTVNDGFKTASTTFKLTVQAESTGTIILDGIVDPTEWQNGILGTVNSTQFGITWDANYWYFSAKGGLGASDYFMVGIDTDPNNYASNTGGTVAQCGASFPTENKPNTILAQRQNTFTRQSWGWNGSAWDQSVWNPTEPGEYNFSGFGGDYELKLKKSTVFASNPDTSPIAFYLWLANGSCQYFNAWPPENQNGLTVGTPTRLLFSHTFFESTDTGRVPRTYNTRKGWDTKTLSANSTVYNFFGEDDSAANPWLRMTTTGSGAGGAACTVRAHLAGNRAFYSSSFAGINRYIDFTLTACTNLNVNVQMRYEPGEVVGVLESGAQFYHCALSSCGSIDWSAVSAGTYTRDTTNHNLLLTNVPQTQFSYWMASGPGGPTAVTFNTLTAHSSAAPVTLWVGLLLAGVLAVWRKRSG